MREKEAKGLECLRMSLIGASAGRRLAAGLLDENAGAVRSGLPIGKIRHGVDGVGPHGPVALAAHLFHYHGPASPARVDQQAVAVARLLQVNALLGVRLNGAAAAAALLVKDPGAAAAKGATGRCRALEQQRRGEWGNRRAVADVAALH